MFCVVIKFLIPCVLLSVVFANLISYWKVSSTHETFPLVKFFIMLSVHTFNLSSLCKWICQTFPYNFILNGKNEGYKIQRNVFVLFGNQHPFILLTNLIEILTTMDSFLLFAQNLEFGVWNLWKATHVKKRWV